MTWLKSIWRKMFKKKTESISEAELYRIAFGAIDKYVEQKALESILRPAYDPFTDENKILNGEVESYFE